ncbi:aminomethyl-transferring glycine dehydrogenase [Nakamurella multipartita]|uniref:Glycine dehydrogenase (decarboxylating) n=1 Tax=Nakamurella multipartita (strain ATCC 700099 / DSM 44233 / CIP 104796 / JCM 9543 / NBRC 105858 / Y-104) TaxID=479431 RepID=C8XHJ3_NAKMY|nr:aminomethyl-transferring glycine dehydrogenase [Nakamurella multipartita]ACV80296.1 glycine dehydrogenase [Nakamurella multipartita DSM 44233]
MTSSAATGTSATFADRHIGPDADGLRRILDLLDQSDLDALESAAVPATIRTGRPLELPEPASEVQALAELRGLAARNRPMVQMIGLGYHDTITPGVIKRNVLENPAWYTAYTPYQPEISQGRLEALLNFQTAVADLTGLDIANASMLDEGTAAAEAMTLIKRTARAKSNRFVVDADTLPQTLAVVRTRAEPIGIEVVVADLSAGVEALPVGDFFGLLLSYPGASGAVRDHRELIEAAHQREAKVAVATDLLALTLLTPPGEIGADVAVGSAQRFGVPLGFGGPHAGFIAVRADIQRQLPGRLVGVSHDAHGTTAFRLALQTREQHIRREKATSNICTAQVLLAVMASMYAVYHGPDGLRRITERIRTDALVLAALLEQGGVTVEHALFFDTVRAIVPGRAREVVAAARDRGINLWADGEDAVQISVSESTTGAHLTAVVEAFGVAAGLSSGEAATASLPGWAARTSEYLTHPVFHAHRSETAMLRYLRRLSDMDLALDRSMIPLGSCTMKLNATTEMEAVTWPEFAGIHPFAPVEDAAGYLDLIEQLSAWLCEITGYAAVSLQPNAGSQGELAGLLAIRAYHRSRGEQDRTVCLIPASAHGTNAASAVMAGMKVVVVKTATTGDIDMADLRAKIDQHAAQLAAIMVTYPSTHGVYEDTITELAELVHAAGGQVYVDGANLNALVGVARPGVFGGDVSHLNLHKTFCIPHGGGGPGVGPVAVAAHLAPFLPNHPLAPAAGPDTGIGAIAAAPWGSASILPISWAYVRMMGAAGLRRATLTAVAAANYIARRLDEHYPVLYTGAGGFVAHECILDLRPITSATGVTVDDVAKRLADYGFHAPTMSFPVAGTLMVEPTESEDLAEIDRFCDAMIAIKAEIDRVGAGDWPATDNPLRGAPHTAASLVEDWPHPYSRAEAVFPAGVSAAHKYFPPVGRIDGAFGDRNLVCSCPAPEAYA